MAVKKDMAGLVRAAEKAGYRCEWRKGGHVMLWAPDRTLPAITVPMSASDPRSLQNTRALLRRQGVPV